MFFELPFPLQALVFSLLFPSIPTLYVVKAGFTNVTVDDNDPSISYSSGWTLSNSSNPLDYGGYHHLSDQSNAVAEFNFTGVGIYFLSPLWPYSVQAQLALDGNSPFIVDLRDYTQQFSSDGGSETKSWNVMWGATDLDMGNHTLRISFETDGGRYVVLDALMYTMVDEDKPPDKTSPSDQSSTPTSSQTAASQTTSNGASSGTNSTPIIAGVVVSIVLALVAIGIVIYWRRNRKNILRRYGYIIGAGPSPTEDEEKAQSMFDMVTPGSIHTQENNSRSSASPMQIEQRQRQVKGSSIRASIKQQFRVPIFRLHKSLPELPPPSPTTSSIGETSTVVSQQRKPSFLPSLPSRPSRQAQPPPVVPVNAVKRSGTTSTIASFFPAAIDPRDLTKSPSITSSRKSASMAAPGDDQGGRRELDEAYYAIQSTKDAVRIPTSSQVVIKPPPRGKYRLQSPPSPLHDVPSTKIAVIVTKSPTSPVVAENPLIKPQNLDPISESTTTSPPNTPDSRNSTRSRRSKRRSMGRRVLERERSRKRLGRTTSSPRGPRMRTSTSMSSPPLTATFQIQSSNPSTLPPTPNTAGTVRRRPLPPSPSGSRRPSLSRGPHVLVPLHLITRLQPQRVVTRSPSLNTKIAQWQQQQKMQVQSQSPVTQRSATEGTFTSTMSSSLLSSLSPSLVALFPSPPTGQPSSGDSLSSSLNTETRQAVTQLLTPSPTIRRPPRQSKTEEEDDAKSKGLTATADAPLINKVQPTEEKAGAQGSFMNGEETSVTSGEPAVVIKADLVSSPVQYTPNRPLPVPSSPLHSPTPIPSPSVTSPASPRRPLPDPLSLASSNLSIPSQDPPPYSGRRIPSAFVISPPDSDSGRSFLSRLPPKNVPHTPSLTTSWSSARLASSFQANLGSNQSSLDSTSANVLIELLENDSHVSSPSQTSKRQSQASGVEVASIPPSDPVSLSSHQEHTVTSSTISLPHRNPRYIGITKSRPPALSVISGSVASSAQDTPPESRGNDEYEVSLDLPQTRPLSISKRSSMASVPSQPSLMDKSSLIPPPPPIQNSQQESKLPSPQRIGLPTRPSPRYLEVNKPRPPALAISDSALDTPPASRRTSEENGPLVVNLPEIKPLSTPKRTSVASTASSRMPAPPVTPPPPLPIDTIPPPRIRSKVWKTETARGRAQPFPVNSRNGLTNDTSAPS